ncbi:hypothetical protein [Streptomyces sp. NPDC026659]|uniref:hypothetical protein n=1 Tax=Streptomyces sp. NPDC026659 TaxID=3155123 RepID=UPI0033D61395
MTPSNSRTPGTSRDGRSGTPSKAPASTRPIAITLADLPEATAELPQSTADLLESPEDTVVPPPRRGRHRRPRPRKVLLAAGGLALAAGVLSLVRVAPESGLAGPATAEAEPQHGWGAESTGDSPTTAATLAAAPTALPSAATALGGTRPAPTGTDAAKDDKKSATRKTPAETVGQDTHSADTPSRSDTGTDTSTGTGTGSQSHNAPHTTAPGPAPAPDPDTTAPAPAPSHTAAPAPEPAHSTPPPKQSGVCLLGLCLRVGGS